MADYCYLPPFVTDPNTPPNIMLVFERSDNVMKRAYSATYNSANTYYGFFDTSAGVYYKYDLTNKYFYKPSPMCTPSSSDLGCISGNVLNWALMSSIDVARKALIGFGWPDTGASSGAGNVFTYSGDFNGSRTPISYGQWKDGTQALSVCTSVFTGGTNYNTYTFTLSKYTGSLPTGLTITAKYGTSTCTCTSNTGCSSTTTLVNNKDVAMKFSKVCSNDSTKVCTVNGDCSSGGICQEEVRYGIIQKYADKDQNYTYDSDAPRFGMRRWSNGADKQSDILCDVTGGGDCSSTSKTELFKTLLNAISKAPPSDGNNLYLGEMMEDIVDYFSDTYNATLAYVDNDNYTQKPYIWSNDPAKSCRKSFAIFITSGANLGTTYDISPLHSNCTSLTYTDSFSKNTCHAYNSDLSSETGTQNIRTYVVHTSFLSGSGNADQLTYASRTVGGGKYIAVSDPNSLYTALEEAILNILSTSASASTVATLTTQTRESSTLTQAYFYPKRENTSLRWIGYLRLLWSDSGANLREDTMNTGWLDLKKDKILSFYYDPTLVAYKGRTFAVKNESPYLTIDTCDPTDSKVTTKLNDNILAIWNAQTKLLSRNPDQTDSDKRNIKVGIGNTTGEVTSLQMYDFTTALASTLEPYWSPGSYCSNKTTKWCGGATPAEANASCNYCYDLRNTYSIERGCSSDSNCYYCTTAQSTSCTGASDTTSCVLPDYGYCTAAEGNTRCSLDITRSCTTDADCTVDHSPCVTTDKCDVYNTDEAAIAGTDTFSCIKDCDETTYGCPSSVIKYIRGFDNPYTTTGTTSGPGGTYRIRHKCPYSATDPDTADCPAGHTCSGGECKRDCGSPSDCFSGETCTNSKCESGRDIIKTLKLGDIVYSTPRISPNSAVNGYDVTYSDNSYKNFKGSDTIKNATPIVIVGANDGMVHAFKVSKIKDISPPSTTGGDVTDGYQPARFSDDPPTSDSAPPSDIGKELWAYIPYNAVPYLRWYCEESYCHIPMVDARFTVVDASVDYNKNGFGAGSGSATDARTCDADGTNCVWRRLLIGAMGIGGRQITVGTNTWSSSIFVLDITNPTSPKLLWEMPLPDGALTTGTPAVVRLGDSAKNGTWYLLFGSGPTSVTTNKVNYKTDRPNIYVFDLRTGSLSATLPVGTDVAENKGVAVGDMTAVDFDSDYQVDDIYFGTYGGTGATQTGKFYRLRIRDGDNAGPPVTPKYQTTVSDWDIETVVNAGRPIFAASEVAQDAAGAKWLYFGTGLYLSLEHVTPTAYCTSSTTVCTENSDCSSGTCDPVTGYLEYLYGVKEPDACWKSGGASCTYNDPVANFLDTSNIKFTEAKAVEAGCFCAGQLMSTIPCDSNGNCPGSCGTNKVCSNNTSQSCSLDSQCPAGGTCIDNKVILKVNNAKISGLGVPTSPYDCTNKIDTDAITCIENNINASNGCSGLGCKGWRRGIKGQKMFSKPFVAGGLADYTSFQPTSTVCSLGGNAHLISLHYTTGTAYVQPTIFLAGGTSVSAGGLEIKASVNLGIGVPPLGESLVALPLAGDTYKVITQVSGGLPGTTINPSLPAKSGYVLWIVK
ncbi:MAG: hypothetical protein WA104_00115 [Thermodesulfovibrionales bacterium]